VQAYDFSPVRNILHVFQPISQSQGFDFSPVTKKTGFIYFSRRQAKPAPNGGQLKMQNSKLKMKRAADGGASDTIKHNKTR